MKKIIVFFVLVTIFCSLFVVSAFADAEMDVFNALKENGFTTSYVAITGDTLLIRVGFDIMPENAGDLLFQVALLGYKKDPDAKKVYVEFYQDDAPVIGIFLRGEDLYAYTKGALSDTDLGERAVFFDLRTPEGEISQDFLNNYNTLVRNVTLDNNNTLLLDLEYMGDNDKFKDVVVPMLFSAINDYEGANAVALKFRENNGEKYFVVRAETNDILSLVNGDITIDDFTKKAKIYEASINKSGLGSNFLSNLFNKALGIFGGGKLLSGKGSASTSSSLSGSKKGNALFNAILLAVFFILFLIFIAASKSVKRKIAHILQAKKVDLSRFPNGKKRVYGKFVGIIQSNSPLTAPFSKKQVVMYEARLDRLDSETDADDEGTHSVWNTVWKDNKVTDFSVKQLNADEELHFIHTSPLPAISLPKTFNRSVNERDFPIVSQFQARVFKKRFRAVEKALEIGRKVFFVGGIEKTDNGFIFVPRPGYLNSIFLHSERKLTSHYVKVSRIFSFLALVSLIVALYFGYLLLFG